MKNSPLNKPVSVFVTKDIYNPWNPVPVAEISLWHWLNLSKYNQKVQAVRDIRESEPEKADGIKKSLPAVTPSGVFSYRKKDSLKSLTGLLCVDIDGKDNPGHQVGDLKKMCEQFPWVAYSGLSVSGNGVFAIVPLLHPVRHLEHFRSLQEEFSAFGVTVDPSCSDITRLRIYSFDFAPYVNHQAEPYRGLVSNERKRADSSPTSQGKTGTDEAVARLVEEICRLGIDITGQNKDWFNLAAALASEFGENGREYFHAISQFYQNGKHHYSPDETEKMYSNGMKYRSRYSIRTFFSRCGEFGIKAKELRNALPHPRGAEPTDDKRGIKNPTRQR